MAATEEDEAESRLLSLPPELRNRIYRLVLVESDHISIPSQGAAPKQPALLCVSQQVRQEARSIYILENAFTFEYPNFDATRYIKWSGLSRQHFKAKMRFRATAITDKQQMWPNLLRWIEAYLHRKVPFRPSGKFKGVPCWVIAGHMSKMAKQLLNDDGLSWDRIKEHLERAREMVAVSDSDWNLSE